MWMTSSFRAERTRRAALLFVAGALALSGLALATQTRSQGSSSQIAPDAPRPARPTPPRPGKGEGKASTQILRTPVELTTVSVRRLDADLKKMAGQEFLSKAEEPLAIDVHTARPLGNTQRSSAPVIVLNGKNLLNTRAVGQQTLVAFLPDRKVLKQTNTIEVVWLGNEQTRTKHPLTLRLEDVPRGAPAQ
jgi:hypothetical protein